MGAMKVGVGAEEDEGGGEEAGGRTGVMKERRDAEEGTEDDVTEVGGAPAAEA